MVVTFGFLFLTWGFLSVLNYVLLERFRDIFEIKYSISSLISITFFATYLVVSLLSGRMVRNWGYKLALIIGIYVTAIGCMLLHFAVTVHNYYFFLFSFFLQAVGVTCLQVAANLYTQCWHRCSVQNLSRIYSASRRTKH
jgi:MFS transporter, FHS family, L-fucose permease